MNTTKYSFKITYGISELQSISIVVALKMDVTSIIKFLKF